MLAALAKPAAGNGATPDTAKGHHDEARHMDPGADDPSRTGERTRGNDVAPPPLRNGSWRWRPQTATLAAAATTLAKAGVAAGGYSKANPFPARMLVNRRLTHARLRQGHAPLRNLSQRTPACTYEVGDALGVVPDELARTGR